MAFVQKRNYPRFNADVLLWWIKDWDAIPICLMDISEKGMFCEFPEPLSLNDTIELQFEFPDYDEPISSRCEVVHCREKGARVFLVGLKILKLTGIDEEIFARKMTNLPQPVQDS